LTYNAQHALDLLRLGSGQPDARFREGQQEAIRHVVEGRGRLLVVQKTGWGKSFVYFIATKLLREQGNGPALLISPLLALMRNQIAAAERMGVRAVTINSDNQEKWADVEAMIQCNEVDILLISPERLANERFRTEVLARVAGRIALLVIDEAHCFRHSQARRSASGVTPDGAVWFDKASTTTGISRMNWSKPVRGWCENGTRNRRRPG